MKKFIFWIPVIFFTFMGYVLFKVITNNNIQNQKTDNFANKQKCAVYLNDINNRIKESNNNNGGGVKGVEMNFRLEELWFSEKYNSCLYSIESTTTVTDGDITKTISSYQIWDYLTSQQVPFFGDSDKYKEKRKELN